MPITGQYEFWDTADSDTDPLPPTSVTTTLDDANSPPSSVSARYIPSLVGYRHLVFAISIDEVVPGGGGAPSVTTAGAVRFY